MSGTTSEEHLIVSIDVVIRRCREDDLAKLEWFGAFAQDRLIFHEVFAQQQRGHVEMLVADVRGFPVGQAWLDFRRTADRDCPLIWALRVIEPLHRAGIGRRLVAQLEALAQARGERRLELAVEKHNAEALAFYQRLGWKGLGDRKWQFSSTTPEGGTIARALDEWILTKSLSHESN
jgi:ribosomal protein S18 acetylase RimI-like enzyme